MKCFLFLLIVGSGMFVMSLESEYDEQQQCIMGCTPHLEPICAKSISNGIFRTFDNPCMMQLENSCFKADYEQTSTGECPQQST